MAKAVVLLSVGRNPVSGRARMARAETRAIEMAVASFGREDVFGLHASPEISPVLREYLGLGLACIEHVQTRPGEDALPSLMERLRQIGPDLVFCGQAAETGRASGIVAYACADALQSPVIANVLSVTREGNDFLVVQGMGKGRRRQLRGPSPVVLAVDAVQDGAPIPSMANIRAGRIDVTHAAGNVAPTTSPALDVRPARVRPKKSFRGTSSTTRGSGVEHLDPESAAERILDYLRINNIIQ